MSDPYQILGVSSTDTDEKIAQTYRKLAKKYHPDLNPGNKEAERKMRQINEAYEQIRTQKHGGVEYEKAASYGNTGYSYGGYSGESGGNPFEDGPFASGGGFDFNAFFSAYQQQRKETKKPTSQKMTAVYNHIQHQQYSAAISILNESSVRDGEWYYYSALANSGMGNRVTALNHAREAVRYDQSDEYYKSLLNELELGGAAYNSEGQSNGFNMNKAGCSILPMCFACIACSCIFRPCG